MRLSDIMSNLRLESYAEVALILFIGAFVAIVVWTYSKRQKAVFESARYLPLDDGCLKPSVHEDGTPTEANPHAAK